MSRLHQVFVFFMGMVGSWLWLGLLPGVAHAQVVSGGKDRPVVALERSGHFGGSINDMVVDGNNVYLVAGTTLEVVNVSDGANPTRLFSIQLPSRGLAVDFENGLAYVGTVDHGLQIIDVWRDGGPVFMGTWSGRRAVSLLTISGSRAYLRFGSHVDILDLANPAAPVLLGTYTDVYTPLNSLHLAGNLLLLPVVQSNCSAGSPGCETYLRIVDVSNPAAPVLLASWTEPSAFIYDVVVHNGYAYVADYARSFYILDLSNPATPSLVSTGSFFPPRAVDLFVAEGTLYVAVSNFGTHSVQAYSLANPTSPELFLTYNAADGFDFFPYLQTAAGKVIFLSGNVYNDVEIVSFPVGGSAAKMGSYAAIGTVHSATLIDPYLFVLADGVFYIVNADLPLSSTPISVRRSSVAARYIDFATNGAFAYLLRADSTIDVVNLSNPGALQLVTSFAASNLGRIESIYLSGNMLYGIYSVSLYVFDVSNPAQPANVTISPLTNAAGATVYGNYLYISQFGSSSLQIFDVSNPSSPQAVGSYDPPRGGFYSVLGTLLVVGSYSSLYLVDLTVPTAPALLSTVPMADTQIGYAARSGNILYIGTMSGLTAVDVRDTSNPIVLGTFPSFSGIEPIVTGDRGYMVDGDTGLYGMNITTFLATDFVHLPLLSR